MDPVQHDIILTSERLIFRQHIQDDLGAFCDIEQDTEVRRYVGGYPRARKDAEQRFMKGVLQPVSDRLWMWATLLKTNNAYIGRCGIYPHFNEQGGTIAGEGTLAFYIEHKYWGMALLQKQVMHLYTSASPN